MLIEESLLPIPINLLFNLELLEILNGDFLQLMEFHTLIITMAYIRLKETMKNNSEKKKKFIVL
jgi:hypothetical protein